MDRELLTSQLATSNVLAWRAGRLRGTEQQPDLIRWAPVATLTTVPETPALQLGVSSKGRWLVVSPDGTVDDFESTQYYWPLFSLMEISHHDASEKLRVELAKHNLDKAWLEHFPFERIVAAALKSDSKYWPDHALSWVPSFRMSAEIRSALELLSKQGRTQQQRHRAKKLLAAQGGPHGRLII
jgi:hypothetical protein